MILSLILIFSLNANTPADACSQYISKSMLLTIIKYNQTLLFMAPHTPSDYSRTKLPNCTTFHFSNTTKRKPKKKPKTPSRGHHLPPLNKFLAGFSRHCKIMQRASLNANFRNFLLTNMCMLAIYRQTSA